MRFKDLRFLTKLVFGIGLIVLLMAAVNMFSIHKTATLKAEFDEVAYSWLPRAIAISEINLNTSKLRLNQLQHAYLTDPETQREKSKIMIELIDKIDQNRDIYETLRRESRDEARYSEDEGELYKEFDRKWERYQDVSFQFFRLTRENQTSEAIQLLNEDGETIFSAFGKDLDKLVDKFNKDAQEAGQLAETTFQGMRKVTITILLLSIIFSIIFAGALVRLIMIPLKELEQAAQEVTLGNLDIELEIDSKDEIGILAKTFNRMTRSLKLATTELQKQARELTNANRELEAKSTNLEEQKVEIERKNEELQSTMNKLKSTQSKLIESEKMASLGQLTAGIAHEINNPINFVYSSISPLSRDINELRDLLEAYQRLDQEEAAKPYLENIHQLKRKIEPDILFEEIKHLLKGIHEGADRTKMIVAGLQNFSRIDEGELKSVDIHEGIESTLMLLQSKIKRKIEVRKYYTTLSPVECYPGKLNQVFMNILNNAIQSIVGEGRITIETRQEGEEINIAFTDTGKGIPKEMLTKIFDPFFTTKDVGEGSGLGLAISYGIVEHHRGRIEVKSSPGNGSTFTIVLPVKQKQPNTD